MSRFLWIEQSTSRACRGDVSTCSTCVATVSGVPAIEHPRAVLPHTYTVLLLCCICRGRTWQLNSHK
jgi:hypothetical protein